MRASPPPPPFPLHFSSLDEKVICSHPVWGLWPEFGASDRLPTGVSATDKQRQRQERRRRLREGLKLADGYGRLLWPRTDLHSPGWTEKRTHSTVLLEKATKGWGDVPVLAEKKVFSICLTVKQKCSFVFIQEKHRKAKSRNPAAFQPAQLLH